MKKTGLLILSFLILSLGTGASFAEAPVIEGFFPAESQAYFILSADKLPANVKPDEMRFRLNQKGLPFIAAANTVVQLMQKADEKPVLSPITIANLKSIDDFIWTRGGTLIVISGKELIEPNETGYETLLHLPSKGMRLAPANKKSFYLYGGDTDSQRRNLYLYLKGAKLLQLLSAPGPITAVAGDGKLTFVALGNLILMTDGDKDTIPVYETRDEVTSLAPAPPQGLFFSTKTSVGYISRPGVGYIFIKNKGAQLDARGDSLFLFIKDEGIMKCFPVSGFEDTAQKFINSKKEINKG